MAGRRLLLRLAAAAAAAAAGRASLADLQPVCVGSALAETARCELRPQCCDAGLRCLALDGDDFRCLPDCADAETCAALSCTAGLPRADPVDVRGFADLHGRLRVDGVQLVNEAGAPVQLAGFVSEPNLFSRDACMSKQGIETYARDFSANVLRLSVMTKDADAAAQDRLVEAVNHAAEAGIYAIVTLESGSLNGGDPNDPPGALEFWTAMASRLHNHSNVLYDIAGRVGDAENLTWENLKVYHMAMINAIRAFDDHAVILVATPFFNQRVSEARADPLTGVDNVMYSVLVSTGDDAVEVINGKITDHALALPLFVEYLMTSNHAQTQGPFLTESRTKFDLISGRAAESPLNVSWVAYAASDIDNVNAILDVGACDRADFSAVTCNGVFLANYLRTLRTDFVTTAPSASPSKTPSQAPTSSPTFRPSATPSASPQAAAPVAGPVEAPTVDSGDEASSSGIIIGVLAGLLVVSVAGLIFYRQQQKNGSDSASSPRDSDNPIAISPPPTASGGARMAAAKIDDEPLRFGDLSRGYGSPQASIPAPRARAPSV